MLDVSVKNDLKNYNAMLGVSLSILQHLSLQPIQAKRRTPSGVKK